MTIEESRGTSLTSRREPIVTSSWSHKAVSRRCDWSCAMRTLSVLRTAHSHTLQPAGFGWLELELQVLTPVFFTRGLIMHAPSHLCDMAKENDSFPQSTLSPGVAY
jgi:hypothetical protein